MNAQRTRKVTARTAPRCALCRLDQRRVRQRTLRRVWISVYVAAFAVFAGLAMLHNLLQGVALAALGVLILGVALLYETAQRRR